MDRRGLLWIVVGRCGSLWVVVGSLWVVPGFSNYELARDQSLVFSLPNNVNSLFVGLF